MSQASRPGVATIALHGGGAGKEAGSPLVHPLVQSSTFRKQSIEIEPEHAYSRVSNPTVSELERRLGALEGALPAVCFSSGLAAESALTLAVLQSGDHVVCASAVYGGTVRLFREILSGFGVDATFVDAADPHNIASAITRRTRLILVETPANPTLALTDIAAAAEIARGAGALLAVDNTFLTAALQRPLDLGADVSIVSTTKQTDGHSVALGGALVTNNESLRERLQFVRKSTGAILTPFNAWLTIQGLKTLPLRLEAQSRHAQTVAEWLVGHPQVECVHYPGLETFPQRALAQRQHLGAHGNVLSFVVLHGRRGAAALTEHLRLCTLVEHVGSVETLVTHSASMTHADVSPEHRAATGVVDGLVRLSVGLEDPQEIIDDLRSAFDAVAKIEASPRTRKESICAARQ